MNYAELLKEDEKKLRLLHERCRMLVESETKGARHPLMRDTSGCTKSELAWSLYAIGRGKTYNPLMNEQYSGLCTFKLPFRCLDELELKLAMRGY